MSPVRVKVYGLVSMTKPTYLRLQGLGLVLLVSLMIGGGMAARMAGTWWPAFPPPSLQGALVYLFWIALVTILLEMVETTVILGKFARTEAAQAAGLGVAPPPEAIQAPPASDQHPSH